MTNDNQIAIKDQAAKTERIGNQDPIEKIRLGDWYWCKPDDEESESLWCVMHVGSNFARIDRPNSDSSVSMRIHFNEWDKECRYEPNPQWWFDHWSASERREIRRINQARAISIRSRLINARRKRSQNGTSNMANNPEEMNIVAIIKRVKNPCEKSRFEWCVSAPDAWSHTGTEVSIEDAKKRAAEVVIRAIACWREPV